MMLSDRDDARRLNSPPLQGRGRGWGLTAERIDQLRGRATAMRRNPTEPEKRLWAHLSRSQLGGFKFRRQATVGTAIADFLCPAAKLIVEVDGHTHADPATDARRDEMLAVMGYRVLRVTNTDVMTNIEGVLEHLLEALRSLPLPFRGGARKGRGADAAGADSMSETVLDIVEGRYGSQNDEAAFFGWLDKISCVASYRGQHENGIDFVRVKLTTAAPNDADLRDLLALHHRYNRDMKRLARFRTVQNGGLVR